MTTQPGPTGLDPGRLSQVAARLLVRLRWWVVAAWSCTCLASWAWLPTLSQTGGGAGLSGFVPADTPAVALEMRSVELFGFPLTGRTVVVQRDAGGLSPYDEGRTMVNAVAASTGRYPGLEPLRGAVPLVNRPVFFAGSREQNTTALTYLLFDPLVSFGVQTRTAHRYAEQHFGARDSVVGVTGSVPARAEQGDRIRAALPTVEGLTLGAIMLIVGVAFRSLVAPLVAVATTAVAYVITLHLSGTVAELVGVSTPAELEPVVVALLLGVMTDYTVFFVSALRQELATGASRLDAARAATAHYGHIVAVAGLAVAAGTAALLVAESPFFRALGPALVFTVLVALLVAVTLLPAVMAILGRWVFWPSRVHVRTAGTVDGPGRAARMVDALARRRAVAGVVVAASVLALSLAALALTGLKLGVSFVGSLPQDSGVRQAAAAARAGFAPGILSPTTVLVQGEDLSDERAKLRRLGTLLEDQPGVAGVLGPGDLPPELESRLFVASGAARYLVVLDHPALSADAIASVDALADRLPELTEAAGLQQVIAGAAGDSAAAAFVVEQTKDDLLRIAMAALGANLLMLVLFLRAIVAAVYLLAAGVLSLAASLGLTMLLFGTVDPAAGLTFYVPFAAAVMLLAFGSDYNIFAVGNIWEQARHHALPDALVRAMPRSISALFVAGLALATSFGLLAVVPLTPFRQLAFVMFVGIMLDVLVVRSLMLPALFTVVGRVSAWPSKHLSRTPRRRDPSLWRSRRTDDQGRRS